MTNGLNIQQLSQRSETPATLVNSPNSLLYYRYAYGRSADSRKNDDTGQDYVAFYIENQRLAFAVCDGVSQSFFGDLAAAFVGNELVAWMFHLSDPRTSGEVWKSELENHLQSCTQAASRKIAEFQYPEDMPGMVQMVLEKKRQIGSESTLVAGVIDLDRGWYAMVWMGDTRLRIWSAQGELTATKLGDTFHTRERWSSNKGLVGSLHACHGSTDELVHLMVYTDGLSLLDKPIQMMGCSNAAVDKLTEEARLQPNSDDTSLFEWWSALPQFNVPLKKPVGWQRKRPVYECAPVQDATMYEIALCRDELTKVAVHYEDGPKTTFTEDKLKLATDIYIRAWNHDEPGEMNFTSLDSFPKESAAEPLSSEVIPPAAPQLLPEANPEVSLPPSTIQTLRKPVSPPQVHVSGSQQDASNELPTGPVPRQRKSKMGSVYVILPIVIVGAIVLAAALGSSGVLGNNIKGLFGSPTETPTVSIPTKAHTPRPSPTPSPVPSETAVVTEPAPEVATIAATSAVTPEATISPDTTSFSGAQVIQAKNVVGLAGRLVENLSQPGIPQDLILAPASQAMDGGLWSALLLYPPDPQKPVNAEVYDVDAAGHWKLSATLVPLKIAAFATDRAAGVAVSADKPKEVQVWSRNQGEWILSPQPIQFDGEVCALVFEGEDLYLLNLKGRLTKYARASGLPEDEQEIVAPWVHDATTSDCALNIFHGPDGKKLLAYSVDKRFEVLDLNQIESDHIRQASNYTVKSLDFLDEGWLLSIKNAFILRDQNLNQKGSVIDERFNSFSIHRAGLKPFLVALDSTLGGDNPNCFYLDFSRDKQGDGYLKGNIEADLCKAQKLFFTVDGKFLITLSPEGVMVWFSNKIE